MTERKKQEMWRKHVTILVKDMLVNVVTALSFVFLVYIYNQRYYEKPWTTFEVVFFMISVIICSGFIIANFADKRMH